MTNVPVGIHHNMHHVCLPSNQVRDPIAQEHQMPSLHRRMSQPINNTGHTIYMLQIFKEYKCMNGEDAKYLITIV
jgi:hypothetical protein